MPKFRNLLSSFNFGEVTPKVHGRTDLDSYRKSCKQLKNFINNTSGGVTKRYGSKYITDTIASGIFAFGDFDANSILIPYSYSNGEEFMIILESGDTGYATAIDMSTKRQFRIFNNYAVTGWTTTTGATYTGFLSTTDLSKLQYSQRGDFLHIVHPDFPPFIIQRTAEGQFQIRPHVGGDDLSDAKSWEQIPYQLINTTATGVQINTNTVGAGRTLTANADLFLANHVGSCMAISNGSSTIGYAMITAYASATSVTVYLFQVLAAATTDYTNFYFSAWSPINGFPRTVAHANSRIIYGGTQVEPDTIWASQENDVFQMSKEEVNHAFSEAITNDDAFRTTLNAGKLSEINWIMPTKQNIAFGTSDIEYTLFGPDQTSAFGALNLQVSVETSYGSEHVQAPLAGSRPIFVQRGGQNIRDFFYNRDNNGYISNELTILAGHMGRKSFDTFAGSSLGKVKRMVFQKSSDEIVWVQDTNNYLYAFTRSESNGVLAFHDHNLGGFSDAAGTEPPKVLSLAVNKAGSGTHDELWMLVQRYTDSASKTTLEYIGREWTGNILDTLSVDIEDHPVFMDNCQLLKAESPDIFISYDSSLNADTSDGTGTDTFIDTDVAISTEIITLTAHPFADLQRVRLTSSGTLPAGLSLATNYWVIYTDANSIQLATTLANAAADTAINITDTGTGTQTITSFADIATGTGSPATPAGFLDLSGGGVKYVSYDGISNVDVAQVGCIRFKFKPDFTATTLPTDFTLFSIAKADADADNLIELYIDATGTYESFKLIINDSAGTPIINDVTIGVLTGKQLNTLMESGMGTGKYVEIELNYDLTTGATQLFMDGTQIGATIASTGTRDTTIDLLRIGSDYTGANASDGFFKDFQFYPTVQHTADYKPTLYWDGTTAVKGLELYDTEIIKVLNDGVVEADKTVAADSITLTEAGTYLLLGYGYTSILETTEIEDGAAIGTAQGAIKRLSKAFARFFRSANASVGSDIGDADPIEFRLSSESVSDPITLKTGIIESDYGTDLDLAYSRSATFYLESSAPLPCSVVSISTEGVTGD